MAENSKQITGTGLVASGKSFKNLAVFVHLTASDKTIGLSLESRSSLMAVYLTVDEARKLSARLAEIAGQM